MTERKGAGVSGLRPNKRYITGHNADGKSIHAESPDQSFVSIKGVGGKARSYAIDSVPAKLARNTDIESYKADSGPMSYRNMDIVTPTPGAALAVVDLEPGASTPMHRTVSIDFSICVIGEIDHELDSGEIVRLYPGDHIIQRGTMHRWINPSKDKPARAVACTIPCIPFDVAGKPITEVHYRMPKQRAKL